MDPNNQTGQVGASGADGAKNDLELMEAIAGGDRTAISALYDRHAPLLLAVCVRVLRDAGEAEDVLCEVFFELWARATRFDATRGSPVTYLLTLARSRAIDRKRSLASRPSLRSTAEGADGLESRAAEGLGPLQNSEFLEQWQRVRAALSGLDPEQRQALECAYFEGLSHTQIALKLNQPLGSVKTYIRQGLIRLRTVLRISS